MRVKELAHVVLKVSDLDRSLAFYRDTLGLPVAQLTSINGRRAAFFRIGSKHHDFAMVEFPGLSRDDRSHAGVLHLAFNVGEQDPDGIIVELFVDRDPAAYRNTSEYLGAPTSPLTL